MAKKLDEVDEDIEYLNDYIEEIDEDLGAVEEEIYGDCDCCDGCDEEYFEIVCPSCGETVCFDQELDPETLTCPACGEKFGCIVDEEDFKDLND